MMETMMGSTAPEMTPGSLLEMVHPRGRGELILVSEARESGGPAWLKHSVKAAASSLEQDGLIWLTPRRRLRPWIRYAAAEAGLEVKGTFALFTDGHGLKMLVPVNLLGNVHVAGLTGRHVGARRLAALTLNIPGALRLFPMVYPSIGFALGRRGGPPLFDWLVDTGEIGCNHHVLLRRSWHRPDFVVAYIFSGDPGGLAAVAKIATTAEAAAMLAAQEEPLRRLAPAAAGRGVQTPILQAHQPVARPALVTRAIRGELAAGALERRPAEFRPLVHRLALWLTGWNEATKISAPEGAAAREFELLALALERHLDHGREYFAWLLRKFAEEPAIPHVASHGDLTMWNVVLARDHLGVLDWEEARARDLPLGDLFYAMVDALAATTGYRDRVASFRTCFFGAEKREADALVGSLAQRLGLGSSAVETCFHLCWLRHARNEVLRNPAGPAGPFLQIVRQLAGAEHHPTFG
jgi:hypothetical protein